MQKNKMECEFRTNSQNSGRCNVGVPKSGTVPTVSQILGRPQLGHPRFFGQCGISQITDESGRPGIPG